ncbi:hypothetical protein QF000_000325 [Paraburkholderia atlantica]|uniref:Uncharacterized protein n=2 Tax=Paraburkholderia TaxID=1822464 RepID=A0A7W8LEB1_9BURK|nr:hypothetical protein [Paraburkholderia youngii]MBB5420348.1 hypothetical protein [Paraburkholderia atlantica]MBB5429299.1 hypothetical protein [Paraburkholderia atlantica]
MEEVLYREFQGLDGGVVHRSRAIVWTLFTIRSTGSRQRSVPRLSPFPIIRRQFGDAGARYMGLVKNAVLITTRSALGNL